jgi:hypothetical protein
MRVLHLSSPSSYHQKKKAADIDVEKFAPATPPGHAVIVDAGAWFNRQLDTKA